MFFLMFANSSREQSLNKDTEIPDVLWVWTSMLVSKRKTSEGKYYWAKYFPFDFPQFIDKLLW